MIRAGIRFVLCAALLSAVAALAQHPATSQKGAVPSALLTAKKIFVSNAGADSGLFPEPFSGDPDRAYFQLYQALSATGRFEVVADPSEADLVLELQLTAPNGPSQGSKQLGAAYPVPMFRLVVYDRRTHFILWTFTRSIEVALLQKTHDRNFDEALTAILLDFEQVAGMPAAPPIERKRPLPQW